MISRWRRFLPLTLPKQSFSGLPSPGPLAQTLFLTHLPFFSSAVSAKIYYASLCVTNEVGRPILLKPDKGNPQGFEIAPDSTLEVTLMSMSTDGAPIKPVYFIAEDKQTYTHLRINDFDKAFPVTPRDGRKPCKTLLVTVARKCSLR